jgi:hypothetical protein
MAKDSLSKLIKDGYTCMKSSSRLKPWVLPEHGFNRVVDEVGDEGILKMGEPLGLGGVAEGIKKPDRVSSDEWLKALNGWPPLSQFEPVVIAFMEAAVPTIERLKGNPSDIDPETICCNMTALLMAPFAEQGKNLTAEIAKILGVSPAAADVIRGYAKVIDDGDTKILERVNRCIIRHDAWQKWVMTLQEEAQRCPYIPKLIAVTPPPSAELAGVLAILIGEGNDESGRDH